MAICHNARGHISAVGRSCSIRVVDEWFSGSESSCGPVTSAHLYTSWREEALGIAISAGDVIKQDISERIVFEKISS